MCIGNDELWSDITRTGLTLDRRVLPFQPPAPESREGEPEAAASLDDAPISMRAIDPDELPSSLRPPSLVPDSLHPPPHSFRAPHRAVEALVVVTATLVAVFTVLLVMMVNDDDRSAADRANEQPVSVAPTP